MPFADRTMKPMGEQTISDLLREPIIRKLMVRDGVDEETLRRGLTKACDAASPSGTEVRRDDPPENRE